MVSDTKTWLHRIVEGDEASFKLLFDFYYQRLIHFSIYYLKSLPWAEEAVADVFFQIWKNRKRLPDIDDLESYLYRAVKNQSLHYLRRSLPIDQDQVNVYEVEWVADDSDPEATLLEEEYQLLVQKAILSLPPKCREVFRLAFSDKLKQKEIALLLDISEKTVEAHIAKAYKRIAEYVNKEYRNPKQIAALFTLLPGFVYFASNLQS